MPVTAVVDTLKSLTFVKANGIVSLGDLVQWIRTDDTAKTSEFPLLFDAIDVRLDLSIGDLHSIAAEARDRRTPDGTRRVAVVTDSYYIKALASAYAELVEDRHPEFEVFSSTNAAIAWLNQTRLMSG